MPTDQKVSDFRVSQARAILGDDAFFAAYELALSTDEAIEMALEESANA